VGYENSRKPLAERLLISYLISRTDRLNERVPYPLIAMTQGGRSVKNRRIRLYGLLASWRAESKRQRFSFNPPGRRRIGDGS